MASSIIAMAVRMSWSRFTLRVKRRRSNPAASAQGVGSRISERAARVYQSNALSESIARRAPCNATFDRQTGSRTAPTNSSKPVTDRPNVSFGLASLGPGTGDDSMLRDAAVTPSSASAVVNVPGTSDAKFTRSCSRNPNSANPVTVANRAQLRIDTWLSSRNETLQTITGHTVAK